MQESAPGPGSPGESGSWDCCPEWSMIGCRGGRVAGIDNAGQGSMRLLVWVDEDDDGGRLGVGSQGVVA